MPSQPVFMPGGDLKWTDLDPNGAAGVKIEDLWGDHAKGAFGASCDKASDCLFFLESDGAFDLRPVAGGNARPQRPHF